MLYQATILSAHNNPALLESLYQTAQQENRVTDFAADLQACYQQQPQNLLYAAWHYRLQQASHLIERSGVNWKLAVPLAILLGLIFWILSLQDLDLNFADGMPYLAQIWALLGGSLVIVFLTLIARRHRRRALGIIIGGLILGAYVMLFSILPNDRNYQLLMAVHLPLLAWIGVGVAILGGQADHQNRFAFLIKSIEYFVVSGLYAIGGAAFMGLTQSLFWTIAVRIPEPVEKLIVPGGIGLIIVLAAASVYDPMVEPAAQNFRHGLSKLFATLMRILMPLTLLVLVIFGYFILQPDNFWIPFNNRDALITYNAMLFAIVLLLIGAIPPQPDDLPPRMQAILPKGIMAVAVLTVLISLYAMSATLYRTYLGVLTMNRLTMLGWNTINIGLLLGLIYRLLQAKRTGWVTAAQTAFSQGMIAYIAWTIFIILSVPFIFGQGLATGWTQPAPPTPAPASTKASPPTVQPAQNETARPTLRQMVIPTPTPAQLTPLPANCPPACAGVQLAGAYLPQINLANADLSNTNLAGADLSQADLQRANLQGADLRGTDLTGARLEQAALHGAKIDQVTQLDPKWRLVWQILNQGAEKRDFGEQNADLSQANLRGANLREAIFAFGSLREADVRGADLTGATLNNVSLHQTILDETTHLDHKWRLVWEIVNQGVRQRDLSGVDLSQADLQQADLRQTNLGRAVLTDTNLSQANLYGADLRGAILTAPDPHGGRPHSARLDQADLAGVTLDPATQIEDKWRLVWAIVNQGAQNRDLSGADLSGADLHELDLSGATLVGARLDSANLRGANLSGANFSGALLQGADLTEATLAGANFYEAELAGARLPADLAGANFRKARLNGADLAGLNLGGLNLSRAELRGANLAEANLRQADLSEAHLEGAYLWQADLRDANMRGVYLHHTYLLSVNLSGADLTGAEFRQTVMPDGTIHE